MIGTAQEVAEWYEAVTGYRFHPTVIGQLYARRRFRPNETMGGKRLYDSRFILGDLDALRVRRLSLDR